MLIIPDSITAESAGEAPDPLAMAVRSCPDGLPVAGYRNRPVALLRANNVVVVCGDIGSGKTTQLPKMAFEALWREGGRPPRIACTQPRRIAAVTVAARLEVARRHRARHRLRQRRKVFRILTLQEYTP